MISVFKEGRVQVNFGPHFEYPPPAYLNAKPLVQRLEERDVENYIVDLIDEVELQLSFLERKAKELEKLASVEEGAQQVQHVKEEKNEKEASPDQFLIVDDGSDRNDVVVDENLENEDLNNNLVVA